MRPCAEMMPDFFAPVRKADADKAMEFVGANGFDDIPTAFSKSGDLGGDGVRDFRRIEEAAMPCHLRGGPRVQRRGASARMPALGRCVVSLVHAGATSLHPGDLSGTCPA